ncbi:hypothetical protein HDU98_012206 [Podochytrium sp. JEL0797]|nr:hypothetical protein HDU98_012206 [Podochytrium sp. JEL0797]
MAGNGNGFGGYGGYNGGGGGAAKYSTNYANASPQPQGGGFSASQGGGFDSPGGGGKQFRKQSLRPVSIKHLSRARAETEGASLVLDGEEMNMVKVIGRITKASVASTVMKYLVSDGNHNVECVKFLSPEQGGDLADTQTFRQASPLLFSSFDRV